MNKVKRTTPIQETVVGRVHIVGEIVVSDKRKYKPFEKRIIILEKDDTRFVALELRNTHNAINSLEEGMRVELKYYFTASEKGTRWYNNLIITDITVLAKDEKQQIIKERA